MEVGAVDILVNSAFSLVFSVIAVSGKNLSQRPFAFAKISKTVMILETVVLFSVLNFNIADEAVVILGFGVVV